MRRFVPGLAAALVLAAPLAAADKPTSAKVCLTCHQPQAGQLRGTFDNVSFKARSIQIRLDDAVEIVQFDPAVLKITNGAKTEGADSLRQVKKAHEVRIAYTEKDGVKTATAFSLKQPMAVPAEMQIKTADVEKLVALGPEKGEYTLIDSRPLMRYQEGYVPTAKNLPFPAFDKFVDRLPADKAKLLVFYCGGPTCSMSPKSAEKAKALGYTNVKVYHDGMPAWSAKNPSVLTPAFLKEAWFDKEMPIVLLDARGAAEAAAGFIKGAALVPAGAADPVAALKLPAKEMKPPVVVYDAGTGDAARAVAAKLVSAGYNGVRLLDGGFAAWQAAKLPVEQGAPAKVVSWAPKPRAGEIGYDEFARIAKKVPADTVLVDVRTPEEVEDGKIKGAVVIPADQIEKRFAELPKEKRVILYCNTGVQAEMAYHLLKEKGFTKLGFLNASITIEKNGKFSQDS